MKSDMGRWARSTWLLALVLLAPLVAFSEKVGDLPKPTAYVTDLAGVLSEPAKVEINQYAGEVERQAHAQIAVVIIKSLDDRPIEDYANDLFHTWGIGPKDPKYKDRGILLLFATNDRKRRIEVGFGLEGILPDAKTGDIGRAMRPLLQQNDWDGAIKLGVTQVGEVIATDAGVTIAAPEQPAHTYHRERVRQGGSSAGAGIVGLIVLFVIIAVVIAIIRRLFGGGGRGGGGGGGLGSWLPWLILGNLMGGGGGRSWGDSGGRGDWGGGGSGGGDSSGGFGGFGGGDSGGGGSSGDW